MSMLRKLSFNRRQIPVPVPVRSLQDVLTWVSETLLKSDEEITRVLINGSDVSERLDQSRTLSQGLDEKTKIEITADSPMDLAVQTIETIANLAMVVERSLKILAVQAWQTLPQHKLKEAESVQTDLAMIRQLCEQVEPLIPTDVDFTVLKYLVDRVENIRLQLQQSAKNPDWQTYARLLLNKLEPSLREVATESENVQTQLYSRISHLVMSKNSGVAVEGT